ncbi:hypothetical protein T440DRAFT_544678 [Plenodomus tracheiphilus IPT5]|uniref:G-protein coupled receptors family 1 profile domain-containing protein n=1 Tax=Plenodomus tracheiphilus IPT5 TaxID=1408161 RepID=A0A6A7BFZ5_9PLEO|nr:hypothetical protein T440DRAFT_544678 [Plenodomus tracheiphilus IPT5]
MTAILWLLSSLVVTTTSAPAPAHNTADIAVHVTKLRAQSSVKHGETATSRTAYTAMSLCSVTLLTALAGNRLHSMGLQQIKNPNFTQLLVMMLYAFSLSFVISAAIVTIGLDLATMGTCRGAIILCLAFYVGSKVTMYIFLVERAHAMRAPFMRRHCDMVWLLSMLAIGLGFGSAAITGFVWPIADFESHNRRCHIGLRRRVTIPLLGFDILLNVFLTLVFVYLISPTVRTINIPFCAFPASRFTMCLGNICSRARDTVTVDLHRSNQRMVRQMEHLLVKTLVGSVLIMLPTLGNLISLCVLGGRELGWVCLTICTLDVTWQTCVFHWLTEGISEARQKALAGLVMESKRDSTPKS